MDDNYKESWCCGLCGFDLLRHERYLYEMPMRSCRQPWNAFTDRECHAACYNLTTAADRRKLLSRVAFTFQPTVPEQARRLRYFQRIAVPMIQPLLGFRLPFPPEIGLCIMSFCPEAFFQHLRILYSLTFIQHSPSDGPRGKILRVPRVEFEGHTYLGMTDYHDVTRLIEDTARNAKQHGFAVGMDHSGIRAVITTGLSSGGPASDDLWWSIFPPRNASVPAIDFAIDGFKFRNIAIDGKWSDYLFDRPDPQLAEMRIETMSPCTGIKKMTCVDLRGASGVSFRWDLNLLAIAAHTSDHDLSPYRSTANIRTGPIDIYIPLEGGEIIKEIWKLDTSFRMWSIVLLVTNQNRTIVMGSHICPAQAGSRNYTMLTDGCSRFFVDTNLWGTSALGFEEARPSHTPLPRHPQHPHTVSDHPTSSLHHSYLYTCATLDGVLALQACSATTEGISGFMLHYGGGRRSCVGQVHLGRLGTTLQVETAPGMILYFAKREKGSPFVERVELMSEDGDGGRGDGSFMVLRWTGLLEWWLSHRQWCRVDYQGQTSRPIAQG